jgi:uncharacterized protein
MSENIVLHTYLKDLKPILGDEQYVFISVPYNLLEKTTETLSQLMMVSLSFFREKEGASFVVSQQNIDKLPIQTSHVSTGLYRCITLNVYSDLESVGLTAAVTKRLTDMDVSANVIAGYFHDHILIPSSDAEKALLALTDMSLR